MSAQLRGLRLSEILVREVMSSPAVLCRETDPVGVAHASPILRASQLERFILRIISAIDSPTSASEVGSGVTSTTR